MVAASYILGSKKPFRDELFYGSSIYGHSYITRSFSLKGEEPTMCTDVMKD